MKQEDQQRVLEEELDRLMRRALSELDLTAASVLGVLDLQMMKIRRMAEES